MILRFLFTLLEFTALALFGLCIAVYFILAAGEPSRPLQPWPIEQHWSK